MSKQKGCLFSLFSMKPTVPDIGETKGKTYIAVFVVEPPSYFGLPEGDKTVVVKSVHSSVKSVELRIPRKGSN